MKNKRLVMLVDDCMIDNYVNRKMIINYHFSENVIEFQNPVKALMWLRGIDILSGNEDSIPDFLFLDLNMPVMDGKEFLSEFDKLSFRIKNKCKIIVLSATIDPGELALSIKNSHVLAFINKPLIKMNLDYVESLLAGSQERNVLLLQHA